MQRTLFFITLKQWRRHKLRLMFTLLGIALGVGVFFAIQTANTTLLSSLTQTIEKMAGKATLQVTANESGVPEEFLDTVRNTPGVLVAEPAIEVIAQAAFETNSTLLVGGVDTTGNQELYEYQFDQKQTEIGDPLVYLSEPFSILISRKFAAAHNLKEEDKLPLYTSQGRKEFTIRGIFEPTGIGTVFDGQIATMDVYSAQFVFNRGRTFDRIDILTDPNVPVETVLENLRRQLPKGVDVDRPASRGKGIENATTAMRQGMVITSFIALLVGLFIIFNSFIISVNQRWKEIGILRSLGVERSQIARMFLVEALVMGIIGSLLGIGSGYFLAIGAIKLTGNMAASIYGFVSTTQPPEIRLPTVLLSLSIGIVASLVAAWLPARSAAQLNPIAALHNIEIRQQKSIIGWKRVTFGTAIIVFSMLMIRVSTAKVGALGQFSYAYLILMGFIIVLPKLASVLAKLMRPVMDSLFGTEGILAVDAMISAPGRTTATVGALMVGLMFVFATGAYVDSYKTTVQGWMDRTISTDLIVKPTKDTARSRTYHLSDSLSQRIARIPGVKRLENVRFTTVPYRNDTAAVITLELEGLFARTHGVIDEGDDPALQGKLIRGEGVFVSRNFEAKWGLGTGGTIQLESPKGLFERPILGISEDYSSDKGTIFMDRALYLAYWQDPAVDFIDVNIKPGVDPIAFKRELEQTLAGTEQVFIYTNREYKQWIMGLIDGFFVLNYMQMAIAILVAAIGIFNTLSISVSERQRELGVIRAIGGLRGQVRKMILLEAVVIALIGLVTGAMCGVLNTYFLVRMGGMITAGFVIPFRFPISLIFITLPIVIIIALIAAWWPSRRATNLKIVEAIGYE
ncbi:MAG: FtsX-like permease family protein [Blastocatellia bacterium]|nr:FtsX-like permease family protein [Blastocatellia bacterium]